MPSCKDNFPIISMPCFLFFPRLNILNSFNFHVVWFEFLHYSHCPPQNAFPFYPLYKVAPRMNTSSQV